jgi:uncharacterized protein (UPF0333 family)
MLIRKRKKILAQSTLEYAVLVVLVVFALLITQGYIKRAIQGKLRSSADEIGDQFSPGAARVTTNSSSRTVTTETTAGGVTNSVISGGDFQNRTVNIQMNGFNANGEFPNGF